CRGSQLRTPADAVGVVCNARCDVTLELTDLGCTACGGDISVFPYIAAELRCVVEAALRVGGAIAAAIVCDAHERTLLAQAPLTVVSARLNVACVLALGVVGFADAAAGVAGANEGAIDGSFPLACAAAGLFRFSVET